MTQRKDKNSGWRFSEDFLERMKTISARKGLGANTLARVILLEWMEEEELKHASLGKRSKR